MAYGLAYFGEFYDYDQGTNRVEFRDINKPDDTGAHRMVIAEKPVVWEQKNSQRFGQIFSKGISVKVSNQLSEGPLFYLPMFGGAETDWRVDYYYKAELVFQGFVVPALYSDSIDSLPNIIDISATDGLSRLKEPYYQGPDGFGPVPLITMLKECLDFTGLALPIDISCRLFADGQNTTDDTTLFDQSYVDKEILITSNGDFRRAADVVTEILEPFMCRIYQGAAIDGILVWIIERIPELQEDPMTFVRYVDGIYFSNYIRAQDIRNLISDVPMLKGENALGYQSGYKKAELTFDLIKYENLLLLGTIFDATEYPTGTLFWVQLPLYKEWNQIDNISIYQNAFTIDPGAISPDTVFYIQAETGYTGDNPPASTGEMDGVWTRTSFTYSQAGEALRIKATAVFPPGTSFNLLKGQNVICIFELYFYDVVGSDGFPIETISNGERLGDWRFVLTPNGVPVDPLDPVSVADAFGRVFDWHVFADDNTDYSIRENRTHEFQVEIPLADLLAEGYRDQDILVKLVPFHYGDDIDNNDLDDAIPVPGVIAVEDFNLSVSNLDMNNVFEAEIDTNSIETYSVNMLINEVANLNYKNGLINAAFKRLSGWAPNLVDPFKPLIEIYFLQLFQTFNVPRFSIVGSIRSALVPFHAFFQEDEFTTKLFYQTGYKHSFHRGIAELTLAEHIVDDGVTLGLLTNTFNPFDIGLGGSLSESERRLTTDGTGYGTTPGNVGKLAGQWYYEAEIISGTPLIGIGTAQSNGVGGSNDFLGQNFQGVALHGGTGNVWQNNVSTPTPFTFGPGDIVSVDVDFATLKISWQINGTPTLSYTFIPALLPWSPAAGDKETADTSDTRINCGQDPLLYTPPPRYNPGWFNSISQ